MTSTVPFAGHGEPPLSIARMVHGDKRGDAMPNQAMQHPATPGQPQHVQQSQISGGMGPGMMMGPGMQGGPSMMQMPMMQMMMQGRMGDMPTEHIEGRIAFLHAALKITSAQMPAWTEFADVLRANAKRLSDVRAAAAQRTATSAVDRLDDQDRWLSARLEGVRALKPAYAKLHAVLDDKQKATADELIKAYANSHGPT